MPGGYQDYTGQVFETYTQAGVPLIQGLVSDTMEVYQAKITQVTNHHVSGIPPSPPPYYTGPWPPPNHYDWPSVFAKLTDPAQHIGGAWGGPILDSGYYDIVPRGSVITYNIEFSSVHEKVYAFAAGSKDQADYYIQNGIRTVGGACGLTVNTMMRMLFGPFRDPPYGPIDAQGDFNYSRGPSYAPGAPKDTISSDFGGIGTIWTSDPYIIGWPSTSLATAVPYPFNADQFNTASRLRLTAFPAAGLRFILGIAPLVGTDPHVDASGIATVYARTMDEIMDANPASARTYRLSLEHLKVIVTDQEPESDWISVQDALSNPVAERPQVVVGFGKRTDGPDSVFPTGDVTVEGYESFMYNATLVWDASRGFAFTGYAPYNNTAWNYQFGYVPGFVYLDNSGAGVVRRAADIGTFSGRNANNLGYETNFNGGGGLRADPPCDSHGVTNGVTYFWIDPLNPESRLSKTSPWRTGDTGNGRFTTLKARLTGGWAAGGVHTLFLCGETAGGVGDILTFVKTNQRREPAWFDLPVPIDLLPAADPQSKAPHAGCYLNALQQPGTGNLLIDQGTIDAGTPNAVTGIPVSFWLVPWRGLDKAPSAVSSAESIPKQGAENWTTARGTILRIWTRDDSFTIPGTKDLRFSLEGSLATWDPKTMSLNYGGLTPVRYPMELGRFDSTFALSMVQSKKQAPRVGGVLATAMKEIMANPQGRPTNIVILAWSPDNSIGSPVPPATLKGSKGQDSYYRNITPVGTDWATLSAVNNWDLQGGVVAADEVPVSRLGSASFLDQYWQSDDPLTRRAVRKKTPQDP